MDEHPTQPPPAKKPKKHQENKRFSVARLRPEGYNGWRENHSPIVDGWSSKLPKGLLRYFAGEEKSHHEASDHYSAS
jgi:hypothetical protein